METRFSSRETMTLRSPAPSDCLRFDLRIRAQGGQPCDKIQRFEDHRRGAIAFVGLA